MPGDFVHGVAQVVLTSDIIIERSQQHLAAYKRLRYVVIVEQLPKNPSGEAAQNATFG